MRPKTYQWSFNADTHITDWLEAGGIAYDVITDEDLHREGLAILAPYRAAMTGTHPEYLSTPMWDAIDAYLGQGGRLMYMGGNGFYWRIAYRGEDTTALEVRRAETGTRAWAAEPGEAYHGFTGEYGGLWLRLGRPPQSLVGVGYIAQGFDAATCYRRRPGSFDSRASWIFDGVGPDEAIGDFGLIYGGAAGSEIDRHDRRLGSPPHALVLASSRDTHQRLLHRHRERDRNDAHAGRARERGHACRHGVLRDAGRRRGLVDRLDRLVGQPVSRRLRQQRRAHHPQRARTIPRSDAVLIHGRAKQDRREPDSTGKANKALIGVIPASP